MKTITLIASMLVGAGLAVSAPIIVHNTGVNNSDVLVAPGASTSYWTLTSAPAGSVAALNSTPFRYIHPAWVADTSAAAWVSPAANGNAVGIGTYVYTLTFSMAGLNTSTAQITGRFTSDNDSTISLNGGAPVASRAFEQFGSFTNFSFTTGFNAGTNTIQVAVNNGGDPTGFIVEFITANDSPIPEPSTYVLAISGLALIVVGSRRAKRA